ncbi:MAG: DEAD/DEAH box helicase [Clostridiales bacterium]|nr:DEAD/DEAH box helicase [Clostridiales bacterium]
MISQLLKWQEECLKLWEANQYRGIVNAVTGSGKTVLALSAAKLLFDADDSRPLKVKIVVPKIFLTYQWHGAICDFLNVPRSDIGFYFGTSKTQPHRKFMIYVINSARYSLARHITEDISKGDRVLLVADECHHYGAKENSKIFDFIDYVPKGAPYYTIGLSATPYSKKYNEILVPSLGKEIYEYTFAKALTEDVISKFSVFNISVDFDKDEAEEYEELTDKLKVAMSRLKSSCPVLHLASGDEFFAILEDIINTADSQTAELARIVLTLIYLRKELVYLARYRIDCVLDIVRRASKADKILIFSERIETAETIYGKLASACPGEAGIYHSEIPPDVRKNTLRRFEDCETRILVSCKTLDEGLNITEVDVGIVVSSTGSRRQRIQRLGRVLRKKQNGRAARVYYLFVRSASEDRGLLSEMAGSSTSGQMNVVNLSYDEKSREFVNAAYQELVRSVVYDMTKKGCRDELTSEFLRNAELGLLSGDWLISESECLEKLKSAPSKSERNYYVAMLLLVRKRSSNTF